MIVIASHIPPPNDQREDTTWDWEGIKIVGNSQCQGNANQDLIISLAMEFNVKALLNWTTFDYYTHFFAYLKSNRITDRLTMMFSGNHAWFMTQLFRDHSIPVIAKATDIPNSPVFIHKAIEQTGRPVSVGTMLSRFGHWIRVHESNSATETFEGNDSFGKHPYNKIKKGGFYQYSWQYLKQNTVRRIILLENK